MLNKYEIQEFIDACCQILGIESVPYDNGNTWGSGEFCTQTRVIKLNQDEIRFNRYDIYSVIAHECVHAKQFDDNRLSVDYSNQVIVFDGKPYSSFTLHMMVYTDRPWEKEANELMSDVAMKAHELLANRKNVA